jgi:hypothetical protein
MKNPLKNRGHWIGFFCLTLSDISAGITNREIEKAEPILALPYFESLIIKINKFIGILILLKLQTLIL